MTPKEKAEQLVKNYISITETFEFNGVVTTNIRDYNLAKKCALIAVDEIIEAIEWHEYETPNKEIIYWYNVKKEIEKL